MTSEEEVTKATLFFYQALDNLLLGKGTGEMQEAWHHEDFVTTVHPFGHWAHGWTEVLATWDEIAAVFSFYHGHDDREDGIGAIHDLRVAVLGDVAYAIGVFKSRMYGMPGGVTGLTVNCTNVLQKRNGVWRIVHHHPDQAPPELQQSLGLLVEAGGSS